MLVCSPNGGLATDNHHNYTLNLEHNYTLIRTTLSLLEGIYELFLGDKNDAADTTPMKMSTCMSEVRVRVICGCACVGRDIMMLSSLTPR